MKLVVSFLAVGLALAMGCAHEPAYTYLPTGPASAGGGAAHYVVPPAAPQADVYVTSFGLTDFDVGGRTVHARLAISNGGLTPLTLDGRAQALVAPGLARQAPSFLNTDAGAGPIYVVAPGHANVFDLYFAVAPPFDDAGALGGFALDWRVDVAGVAVAERTDFQRFADVGPSYYAYPPYVTVGLGFGVGWWYAPYWGYPHHHPPVIRGYYYPPGHAHATAWRGPPPGAWRGTPPGAWRGTPPGWRGAPAPHGPPPAWRGAPPRGGTWRGGPPPGRSGGGRGHR